MVNLLPIEKDETIQAVMPMPQDKESWDSLNILFATSSGSIRRNKLNDFVNIKRNGKIAIKLAENDKLIGVTTCEDDAQIMLASNNGKAIRFSVNEIRVFKGRDSSGVRGIRLLGNDHVVSMSVIADETSEYVLSICENGYGKRTKVTDYRETGRGGLGVANIETSKRNGSVVASFTVFETDQIMLVTIAGQIIRIRINGNDGDNIRITGRKTQGVRLFELAEDEKVVSVAIVREDESENPDEIEMTDITDDDTSNSGADDTPNAKIEQDATDENSETPE
jgi:DNA gyrase subunit A